MDFRSTSRSIRDMLNLKRKYVIPRFQREYSWGDDEIEELWNDLLNSLSIDASGKIVSQEYFLGSIVLVGDEDGTDIIRQVVDGQQRLMTITILFAVLAQKFKEIKEAELSRIVHQYIIGYDDDGKPFTKLVSETPKPFFQYRIQQKEIDFAQKPSSVEERAILNTYEFYNSLLDEKRLRKELVKENRFQSINETYVDLLKVIRDQILNCKVIYVTVNSFEDAYQIFEVLNTKGKDLEPTDVIKNSIFSILDSTEPVDTAFEKWKKIKNNVSGTKGEEFKLFYRYFWLSKYSVVTSNRLVTEFNKRIPKTQESYVQFLNELEKASERYSLIVNPNEHQWPGIEKKAIYQCLRNLNDFGIKQVRTILLAIMEAYEKKTISNTEGVKTLQFLEYFHFVFNKICSMRSSSIERINSRFARQLNSCLNKQDGNCCLKEYRKDMSDLLPEYGPFEASFFKLYYTQDKTDDKIAVQYILRKYEEYCSGSDELSIQSMTIEHVMPESTLMQEIGLVGNLLPLGQRLNSSIGDADFCIKLREYRKSNFKSVQKFVDDYSSLQTWGKTEINERTRILARSIYDRKV